MRSGHRSFISVVKRGACTSFVHMYVRDVVMKCLVEQGDGGITK